MNEYFNCDDIQLINGNLVNEGERQLTCIFSFTGDDKSDLSFQSGEQLFLIDSQICEDQEWLLVRNSYNQVGRIPRHYVRSHNEKILSKYPWLLENATRSLSENLLTTTERGTFLLRSSEHYPGSYTLSIKGDKVEHYRIKNIKGLYTIDEDIFFPDILKLIEHYQRNADGLCENLVMPITWAMLGHASCEASIKSSDLNIDWQYFDQRNVYIASQRLKLLNKIGEGEHGMVSLASLNYDKVEKIVALKSYVKSNATSRFLQEAKIMMLLDCEWLIQFYGVASVNNSPCIVTEFMAGGNVLDYLITRGRNVIDTKLLLSFATNCCQAMVYLETCRIVHRDVAASNVLLDRSLTAKLSDFGLAFVMTSETCALPGKIRVKWTSPESLETKIYSVKSDVWSFGIFIWELFSFGRQPYPRISNSHVLSFIKSGSRMNHPEDCPEAIKEIMNQCWLLDPDERPSFSDILTKIIQYKAVL